MINAIDAGELARRIEPAAFDAWPAREVIAHGAWRLRFTDGYSARGNAAAPFGDHGAASLDDALAGVCAAYRARGLKPLINTSPMCGRLDEELAERGWQSQKPTLTMIASAAATAEPSAEVVLTAAMPSAWPAAFGTGSTDPADAAERLDIISRITRPHVFACVMRGRECLSVGLSAAQDGLAGIFCMRTIPEARRSGHARAIVGALAAWARTQGAELLYLQVEEANAPARALYERAGFQIAYPYRFFAPPPL